MAWRRRSFLFLLAAGTISGQQAVLTSQYDAARTGANLAETLLTPKNVNRNQFGKRAVLLADGAVYAQPLYVPGVPIPGKGVHDAVFVATEHDSVYAFDAAGNPAAPLWHVNFLNADAGITTVSANSALCPFIAPEIGITSTPVIDRRTGTLYVLARTKEHKGFLRDEYVQKLHALAITTGAEKFGGPVEIRAQGFDALRENPRAALLLANGHVYLTWGSSCDVGTYHGWVMAYDAQTLQQAAAFNASPDAGEGGIWLSDTGPAADSEGNIFVPTGNGKFTAANGGRDYGDTLLKLRLEGGRLTVADSFTPRNQSTLNQRDADLGSGGPVLLPEQKGRHPHLVLVGGKGGVLHMLDRDHMGGYHSGANQDGVEDIEFENALFGAPAYWNGHVYVIPPLDVLREFHMEGETLDPGRVGPGPSFPDGGATPAISANGTKDAIVWAIQTHTWRGARVPAVLRAYDALDVRREIYTSEQNEDGDRAGMATRFTIPTVANGRVYVATRGEVDVYGLR